MESKKLIVTASPHITNHTSTRGLMLNVCIALLPALVASTLIFGARALLVTGVTVAACVGFEALYCVVMKKPVPVGDFSAVVTGMILAFNLPATIPLWIAIIGAFVAIVVAKQLFGGLGFNFANPALLGRIVLFIGFAGRMTAYAFPQTDIDALASATPLVAGNSMAGKDMLLQLLLGAHGNLRDGPVQLHVQTIALRQLQDFLLPGLLVDEDALGVPVPQDDVLEHRHGLHQHEVLMHHTDAQLHRLGRRVDADLLSIQEDLSLCGLVQPDEDVHQRALSRAVLP